MTKRVAWMALLVAVAVALYIGTTDRTAPSADERVRDIAATVACPACAGESAADSGATAAVFVRNEISRRVAAGESDDQIRAALAASYGDSILLTPPGTGAASLVWILPVAGLVAAFAGLGFTFRRWRAA
jgi:cytochrome c-type biogenesis protein CcmH/NrfF